MRKVSVGIDFGTTNSLIAFSEDQAPIILGDIVPSIVDFKNNSLCISSEGFKSIKRLFGIDKIEDIVHQQFQDKVSINGDTNDFVCIIRGQSFTKNEIAKTILKDLWKQASEILKDRNLMPENAVITVPAYFGERARSATKHIAEEVGINVLRLISEPTAAAYAYGIEDKDPGFYLVYDLGGGTFDVSIINMQMGIIHVISTGGDVLLGGDDADLMIANYLQSKYCDETHDAMIKIAKILKEKLTVNDSAVENGYHLTIEEMDSVIRPLVDKTIKITRQTLKESAIDKLNGIILVGGSSMLRIIPKLLIQNFNAPILSSIDPEKVVAMGAAMHAENLANNNGNLLIDVVPLSLGVEVYGGSVEKIIPRNTPIPVSVNSDFTTNIDNQDAIIIRVLQGESNNASKCREIGNFLIEIPKVKAKQIKAKVTFSIDTDGILSVRAEIEDLGLIKEIQARPSYKLNDDLIQSMIKQEE